MRTLGIAAIVIGAVVLVLCLSALPGPSPRGLGAGAVIILASGIILSRRGRRVSA